MTIEEFDNAKFRIGDKVEYKGNIYNIQDVDFVSKEFGFWIDSENFEIVKCKFVKYIKYEDK